MDSTSKPYLIRALYEWCCDQGYTPYIEVWVNGQTKVPMQYVEDNRIVLNIGERAANRLQIDNDWIHFAARFAGVSHEIWIPVGHVLSIFARENGEGMGFQLEILEETGRPSADVSKLSHSVGTSSDAKEGGKKVLKFVKPSS
ncbi:MAG: ClpXP protease specificity-enhancing factor [Neisseria sp.]|nr:ClpXP protease specificity-enhancing factor [Neisseria sp.]